MVQIFPVVLVNSLPSFKSLAHSCLQLSVKDYLKANANYRNHCSINGNPLYSMHQLSEAAVTISHYAHTVIAKKFEKNHTQFWVDCPAFYKFLHGLTAQYTRYDFLKQTKQKLYVITVIYIN